MGAAVTLSGALILPDNINDPLSGLNNSHTLSMMGASSLVQGSASSSAGALCFLTIRFVCFLSLSHSFLRSPSCPFLSRPFPSSLLLYQAQHLH